MPKDGPIGKGSPLKGSTGDNGATFLTAVTDRAIILRFNGLKVAPLHTLGFITLGTKTICQFFLVNRQMAMPASHFCALGGDQHKVLVSASGHGTTWSFSFSIFEGL
jgi:hypothetical protein